MDTPNPDHVNQDTDLVGEGNVNRLRSVLQDKHNIVIPNQCDKFIARCLRQKEGNCDDAVKYILAYNDAISNLRYWGVTMLPSASREVYSNGIGIATLLKATDANGNCIIILRPALWDPHKISFEQCIAFFWMMSEYANVYLEEMRRNGVIYIWDCKDYSLQQIFATSPVRAVSLAKWGKNGVGVGFKELHVINLPRVAAAIFKIMRAFLNEKIILHDSVEDLVMHVGGKYLPTNIGGELDPLECVDNDLVEGFLNNDQHFIDMMDIGFPSK